MAVPVSAINNDLELAEFLADHILDEDVDPQLLAVVLSMAKNQLELDEKPEILQDEDTTKTRSSGDTYLSMKSLPDNFRQMIELYVGTAVPPYVEVPFKKRHVYRNSSYRYYIDHKNSQFAICGSAGASETIRQVYLIKTPDFTSSSVVDEDSSTCVWPKEHWPLIAWKAAKIIGSGTDVGADDLSFRMSAQQEQIYQEMLHSFRMWDHDLKLKSIDGRAGYADEDEDFGVEDSLPYM